MSTRPAAQPDRGATPRAEHGHDPAARDPPGRPRDADRCLPAPRRRRPGVPPRVRGRRERLGRYSFLGIGRGGCSRFATASPRRRRVRSTSRPTTRTRDRDRARAGSARGHPPVRPRRRFLTEGMPRFTGGGVGALAYDAVVDLRPTVPLPERDRRRAHGRVLRDRPGDRVRPPDPHHLGDRLAHTDRPDLEAATARRGGDLRRARTHGAAESGGAETARRRAGGNGGECRLAIETSLGARPHPRLEVAKEAIAAGEAICSRLARRQSFPLPADAITGAPLDGIAPLSRASPGQPEPVPVLRVDAFLRGRRCVTGTAPPGRG